MFLFFNVLPKTKKSGANAIILCIILLFSSFLFPVAEISFVGHVPTSLRPTLTTWRVSFPYYFLLKLRPSDDVAGLEEEKGMNCDGWWCWMEDMMVVISKCFF